MDKLILQIAGYIIQITFKEKRRNRVVDRFKEEIKDYYMNFLILETAKKIDFKIDMIDKKILSLDFIKEGTPNKIQAFIPYFERRSTKKVTTYFYISLDQLDQILKHFLEKLLVKNGGFILNTYFEFTKKNVNIFFLNKGFEEKNILTGLRAKKRLLTEGTFFVKKKYRDFYLYHAPFNGDRLSKEQVSDGYRTGKLFLIDKFNNFKVEKIINKEQYVAHFLTFSNISSLYQRIEYKQNASQCMKNFLGFLNRYDLFSYQLSKENLKISY